MPFRQSRRRMSRKPIIQSVKNQFNVAQTLVMATTSFLDFAVGVEQGAPTKVQGNEVPTGAMIFGMAISVNAIVPAGSGNTRFSWYLCKIRQGQAGSDFPSPVWADIGLSEVRNQIFHSEMVQLGSEDAGPYRFNRRVKIPRIYERMRAGDRLVIAVTANSAAVEIDIGARYKYYQ